MSESHFEQGGKFSGNARRINNRLVVFVSAKYERIKRGKMV